MGIYFTANSNKTNASLSFFGMLHALFLKKNACKSQYSCNGHKSGLETEIGNKKMKNKVQNNNKFSKKLTQTFLRHLN